jgi:hypothetical protein
MELRPALKEQYHAGLAMLGQCIERCPEDLWTAGTHPRTFWRIAFHAVYFTHLYLGQSEDTFQPWPVRREGFPSMWQRPWELEPYELPDEAEVYERKEILEYVAFVHGLVDSTVDALDLDTDESGFSWYRNISKLSHQLLNLRHVQGHVGQLSELLMARDVDIDWVSRA